eukprot:3932849-Rhodomonas_salina.1
MSTSAAVTLGTTLSTADASSSARVCESSRARLRRGWSDAPSSPSLPSSAARTREWARSDSNLLAEHRRVYLLAYMSRTASCPLFR